MPNITAGNTCKSTYSHYLRQGHRRSWSSSSPSQLPGISLALVRMKMSNNVTTENINSIGFQVSEYDKAKKLFPFFAFCVKQTFLSCKDPTCLIAPQHHHNQAAGNSKEMLDTLHSPFLLIFVLIFKVS